MYLTPIDRDGAEAAPRTLRPRLGKRRRSAVLMLPLAALLAFGIKGLGDVEDARADVPPPGVTVSRPLVQDVVEWDDYVGRFEASQAVEIRPRVSGALQAIHFRDGDIVRKGQLLFTIDPRPFAAALAEAQAREASARTALTLARSEYARAARLVDDEAVSREEVERLRAAMQSAEAALTAAQAQVRSRALDLEFTQVRAPITGRASDRRIDVGNLVSGGAGGAATMLTTVYALDPLYFSFDGSEALYLKQLRQNAGRGTPAEVEIRLQDESGYRWKGRVDFTDNAIDPASGTMRGRAVVHNPDNFLTPGMFGNMRLAAGPARPALLIPDAAVQTDQARKIVYTVAADGTVATRPVELGPRVGELRVVRSGLTPADRVVVSGLQHAQMSMKVTPREERLRTPTATREARTTTPPPASQATLAQS